MSSNLGISEWDPDFVIDEYKIVEMSYSIDTIFKTTHFDKTHKLIVLTFNDLYFINFTILSKLKPNLVNRQCRFQIAQMQSIRWIVKTDLSLTIKPSSFFFKYLKLVIQFLPILVF